MSPAETHDGDNVRRPRRGDNFDSVVDRAFDRIEQLEVAVNRLEVAVFLTALTALVALIGWVIVA